MKKRNSSPVEMLLRHPEGLYFSVILMMLASLGLVWIYLGGLAQWIMIVLAVCFGALLFAIWMAKYLVEADDGTEAMKNVSEPIREGAEAFLRVQYGAISKLTIFVCALLFILFYLRDPPKIKVGDSGTVALMTCGSFLLGAFLSGVSGYAGMWVSVRANLRVASAAGKGKYPDAMSIALRAGAFCGLLVVTLCILGISILFCTFQVLMDSNPYSKRIQTPHLMVGYGFGASLVALFAQLGGGIYTKAADVGADLVGKVESDIPEDDPRNPAVIADLVGDNVGDCAGRGADLFESISGEIIGAMILGADLAYRAEIKDPVAFMFFPVLIHSMDLIISSIAIMVTKPSKIENNNKRIKSSDFTMDYEKGHADILGAWEDPMDCLQRGYLIVTVLAIVCIGVLARWMLHDPQTPNVWLHYYVCALIGVATSYTFVQVTGYYTDYRHAPVQRIALASKTGHGTNVIAGIAVGMESTAIPAIVITIAVIASYWVGESSGLTDEHNQPVGGLYGTAIATMGMLSTAVYVLSLDTFGPITDNAGGIVEMSNQPEYVRDITDRLDAVGNVTKATTKGYSIGAAGLASFLLFRAFIDIVNDYSAKPLTSVNITTPEVFLSGLLGAMLVFLFSAMSMAAVGKTAAEVVTEVRTQFLDRPGIMQGTERPDYDRCVALVTRASLREMMKPGLLAIIMPLAVGGIMKYVGVYTNRPLLGVECLSSFVMFATSTGILLALFLNNGGGAWDNAKKYIETGAHGGKGSDAHKAAVTGDTVGDPFKDTAGPSIHVLIKLLSTIALVLCPMYLNKDGGGHGHGIH